MGDSEFGQVPPKAILKGKGALWEIANLVKYKRMPPKAILTGKGALWESAGKPPQRTKNPERQNDKPKITKCRKGFLKESIKTLKRAPFSLGAVDQAWRGEHTSGLQ